MYSAVLKIHGFMSMALASARISQEITILIFIASTATPALFTSKLVTYSPTLSHPLWHQSPQLAPRSQE